jgi:hypothetical protein
VRGPRNPSPPTPAATSGVRQPGAWEGTARHWLVCGTRGGTSGAARLGRARRRRSPAGPALPCPAVPCLPRAAARCEASRAGASARTPAPRARRPTR